MKVGKITGKKLIISVVLFVAGVIFQLKFILNKDVESLILCIGIIFIAILIVVLEWEKK